MQYGVYRIKFLKYSMEVKSCLVIGSKGIESDDFINKYVRLLSGITDAPKEFQEAAALLLISSAVGRRWMFRSLPDMAIFGEKVGTGGRLLNLWFIIMGKSRISRRTSGVLNPVEKITNKIIGEQQIISSAFTPESLVKEMSEKSVPSSVFRLETPCFWLCDEVSWFFQQLKKKDSYMASVDAILSKLYDGNTYSRSTIGRGKDKFQCKTHPEKLGRRA
jgi:hypothetical protein